MTQKIISINVNTFTSHEKLAKLLNDALADKNVRGVFFNATSLVKGTYEILVSDPEPIIIDRPIEIIREVEKIVEKEVPLKIVNQIKKQRGATSQYRGVSRKGGRWYAMLQHNHKRYWCGSYTTEMAAAEAYDKKAFELLGDGAVLNFPEHYVGVE